MPEKRNPLLEKERRLLPIGRPAVLIRSAYIATAVSLFLFFPLTTSDDGIWIMFLVMLAVVPILAPAISGGAFAAEREHGTWDLLTLTDITEGDVIISKLRVCLRYGFTVLAGLIAPAILLTFALSDYVVFSPLDYGAEFLFLIAAAGAHLVLCVLVGMLCSTFFRRMPPAMLASYVILFGFTVAILLVGMAFRESLLALGITSRADRSDPAVMMLFLVWDVLLILVCGVWLRVRVRYLMRPG